MKYILLLLLTTLSSSSELFDTSFGLAHLQIDDHKIHGKYQKQLSGIIQLKSTKLDHYSGYCVQNLSKVKCKIAKPDASGKASYYWGRLKLTTHNNLSGLVGRWSNCYKSPKTRWSGTLSNTQQTNCAPVILDESKEL